MGVANISRIYVVIQYSIVKYRLQGTFYWIANGKKMPIKSIEIRVKSQVAVKRASDFLFH